MFMETHVDGRSQSRKERVADYGNLICTPTFSSCNCIRTLFAKYHEKGKTSRNCRGRDALFETWKFLKSKLKQA